MDFNLINANKIPDDEMKRRITEMISDSDLVRYLGNDVNNKVVKYADLSNYKTINELLPKLNDYRIILIESQENSGHWVCLLKYKIDDKPIIEYFNSYGMKMGTDLNFISAIMNRLLGQGKNDLDNLLDTAKDDVEIIYNKKRFQSNNQKVNTCGRWVLLRIIMFKHYGMNLYEFIKFIDELKQKYNMETDIVVASLTP